MNTNSEKTREDANCANWREFLNTDGNRKGGTFTEANEGDRRGMSTDQTGDDASPEI